MKNKLQIFDSEYIENINNAMAFVIESEYDLFGKEIVLEDGRITEVHTQYKTIREMPEIGDRVYGDYFYLGTLEKSKEGAKTPVLVRGPEMFSVGILPVYFPEMTFMFEKAGY